MLTYCGYRGKWLPDWVNQLWYRLSDHEPHCQHVPINNIWRWTESTPQSGWWRSHTAGIYSPAAIFWRRKFQWHGEQIIKKYGVTEFRGWVRQSWQPIFYADQLFHLVCVFSRIKHFFCTWVIFATVWHFGVWIPCCKIFLGRVHESMSYVYIWFVVLLENHMTIA